MQFATKRSFGGQRLSAGRIVWARLDSYHQDGVALVCDHIGPGDTAYFANRTGVLFDDRADGKGDLGFVATKTEEEANAMPFGTWTWPVKV